jgi:hypothetical protein
VTDTKQNPKAAVAKSSEPAKWVVEMHGHFQQSGSYRAVDLKRVLGDPRDKAEFRSREEPVDNLLKRK